MKTILNFAVIQSGYCVFGAGSTELGALRNAIQWLGPRDDGSRYTVATLANECGNFKVDGDMKIIERADDPEGFDSYMKNQGGFVQSSRGNWRNA